MSINVLSLFDGMSCGMIAIERTGIEVGNYYASEVDKYAIKVSQANYPQIKQLGDVNNWREWIDVIGKVDLLLAGFPCQAWSFAGKMKGLDDPRGQLALVLVDIFEYLKNKNPDLKFLFENVRMKKENLEYMDQLFGVEGVCINSALVSAQNRVRYYWCNWDVAQPEDRGIVLADVIEDGMIDRDKSFCIDACYYKGGDLNQYFNKSRRQVVFNKPVVAGLAENVKGYESRRRIHSVEGKSPTLLTHTGGQAHVKVAVSEKQYRKLTPIECERLQTVPDNYTGNVSNTQRYKMLGNGWTVDVIAHILKQGGLNA